jgi:hypothetical protein
MTPADVNTRPGPADQSPTDFVTVLTSKGPRLTKLWRRDAAGKLVCDSYEGAKVFDYAQWPVDSLRDLAHVVTSLGPQSCVIFGRLKDGVDPNGARRRLRDHEDGPATAEEAAHRWLPIDIDKLEACDDEGEFDPLADPERAISCVSRHLPGDLETADCIWQWTSSAGMKLGIRMRLYFWLGRPLTGAEIKSWLARYIEAKVIDGALYTVSQPIYAAAPVFDGIPNPVARRCGIRRCAGEVSVPEIIATTAERKPADGPAGIVYDDVATIAWAIGVIKSDVAEHGQPEIGQASDPRAYALAGVLKDGPRRGHSVSVETIAELLEAHWAPLHFDLEWLYEKAARPHQNKPGCGQAGSGDRVFGEYVPAHEPGAASDDKPEDQHPKRRRFASRKPSEDATLPPLRYWDDHRKKSVLPRLNGGCAIIVSGKMGAIRPGLC